MRRANAYSNRHVNSYAYTHSHSSSNPYPPTNKNSHSHPIPYAHTYSRSCRNRTIPYCRREQPHLRTSRGRNCRLLG